jgi:hypothetical protein
LDSLRLRLNAARMATMMPYPEAIPKPIARTIVRSMAADIRIVFKFVPLSDAALFAPGWLTHCESLASG